MVIRVSNNLAFRLTQCEQLYSTCSKIENAITPKQIPFPWDHSRSTMLTQKGDILGTNLFWAGKVDRSIPTIYFFEKQNLHHAKLPCRKNLLPCIKTCLISNQTIWELLFIRSTCTCIDSSNHLHFLSFNVKTVYNRSRLSADWLDQLKFFPGTCKLCILTPSTMVDLTNQGKEMSIWFIPFNIFEIISNFRGTTNYLNWL